MAKKENNWKPSKDDESAGLTHQIHRLTNLIALLVVKGESQSEKIRILSATGYSNTEIAQLLCTTANSVNVALHRIRGKAG